MKRRTDKVIVVGVVIISVACVFMKLPDANNIVMVALAGLLGAANSK